MEDHKTIENMGYYEKILYKEFPELSDKDRKILVDIVNSSESPKDMCKTIVRSYSLYKAGHFWGYWG